MTSPRLAAAAASTRTEDDVRARRIADNKARMAHRDAHPDMDYEARQRAAREGRDV